MREIDEIYQKAQLDPQDIVLSDLQNFRILHPEIEKYMRMHEAKRIELEQALLASIIVLSEQLQNIKYYLFQQNDREVVPGCDNHSTARANVRDVV
jgi:hypothetical protein